MADNEINAPHEVILGGKPIKLSAPTLLDESELELWAQTRYARIAGIAQAADYIEHSKIIRMAAIITFNDMASLFWATDGLTRLLLQLAQKHQPGITGFPGLTRDELGAVRLKALQIAYPKEYAPAATPGAVVNP